MITALIHHLRLILFLISVFASLASAQGVETQAVKPTAQPVAPESSTKAAASTEMEKAAAAHRVSLSAQELQTQGDWVDATRLIEREMPECGAGPEGRNCRQILDYSLAYVLEQSSTAEEARTTVLLRRAAESYEKVLAESPAHAPTIDNLLSIYERLGEPDRAAAMVDRAIQADPAAAGSLATQLGDLYLRGGDLAKARRSYGLAAEKNPTDESPRRHLVLSYELSGRNALTELMRLGGEWEETFPTAARDAYLEAIRTGYRTDPKGAEQALIRWVDLLGRAGGISASDLRSLPAGWDSPAVRGLQAYLKDPKKQDGYDWWLLGRDDRRSLSLARMALQFGRDRLAQGLPAEAEAIWQRGIDFTLLGDKLRLDLSTELAMLYFHHPNLDQDGEKFRLLEAHLFDEKGFAYEREDLDAVQRYHVALGLIYAERGVWRDNDNTHGGIFQLQNALDTASEREQSDGLYRPLPWIRQRLADGYRATDQKEEAFTNYVESSQAYLDTDDLKKAAQTLASARDGIEPSTRSQAESLATLEEILAFRESLAAEIKSIEDGSAVAFPSREGFIERGKLPWLRSSTSYHLPENFMERQRFKVHADLSYIEERSGKASDLALANALAAMNKVMGYKVQLLSAGDLLRLKNLQAMVGGSVGLALVEPRALATRPEVETENVSRSLLPGDDEPTFVQIAPEAVLATRLVSSLGVAAVVRARPSVRIQGGRVTLLKAQAGTNLEELIGGIDSTLGVKTTSVSDEFSWH